MKRYIFVLLPLSIALVAGPIFLRANWSNPEDNHDEAALPAVKAPEPLLPAQFRQSQPRHWRHIMIPQH